MTTKKGWINFLPFFYAIDRTLTDEINRLHIYMYISVKLYQYVAADVKGLLTKLPNVKLTKHEWIVLLGLIGLYTALILSLLHYFG